MCSSDLGTFRKVENMHLSRMACLIIAENADGKKPQVQIAREYFKQEVTTIELAINTLTFLLFIWLINLSVLIKLISVCL